MTGPIRVGDRVRLRTGDPPQTFTVSEIDGDNAEVYWHQHGDLCSQWLPLIALERYHGSAS